MKIGLLVPTMYMSPTHYGNMVFAPRDLVISLADELIVRGHDVRMYTAGDVKTKATVVGGTDAFLTKEYKLHKLKRFSKERQKWAAHYMTKRNFEMDLTTRAFQDAKEGRIDLIHSYHDELAHFFDELGIVPVLYTLHDPLPTHSDDVRYWLFDRFSSHNYISISDAHQRHRSLKLHFIDRIYHGIDVNAFEYQEYPSDYLLSLGRLVREKGHHTAIQVALDVGMQLEIGADLPRPRQERPYYLKHIKPFLDHPLIGEPGIVHGKDKMLLYKQAVALLMPIEWAEPFGMVMIEAMACGTPVIAYNRGSVPEIVKDGVTGYIIDPDDKRRPKSGKWIIQKQGKEGLIEAVKHIHEIRRDACRKHVEENFSTKKMVDEYETVYKRIMLSH